MLGGLSMWEVVLIFMVVLLLFGAKRLPEIGSSLGKGIREFKSSLREIEGGTKPPSDVAKPKQIAKTDVGGSDDAAGGEPRRLTTNP